MRVFVTGASGFVGKAVTLDLIAHGHRVLGLARSDASADVVTRLGGEPLRGSLDDLESLKTGAKQSDAIIHLAFIHDFADFPKALAADRAAIEAMGSIVAGTDRPLIIVSGTMIFPKGELANEDTEPERGTPFGERVKSAELLLALPGVKGVVVRLAPTVHGDGDQGLIPMITGMARQKAGYIPYLPGGSAKWPAVHRDDAAVLLRLAMEKGRAGAQYNAVAEQGVPTQDFLAVAAKKMGVELKAQTADEMGALLGPLGYLLTVDNRTSSDKTQKELGWMPTGLGLLQDLEANYFG